MLPSHNRFAYSPITARAPFLWPGEKRLAVYVAICIEHFSYAEGGLGLSYSPDIPHPNTYNWAWREYGNRVGGWRLLDVYREAGIAPTVLVNAACYEHCPELLGAYRDLGAEFVGHGRTNSQPPNGLRDDAHRELIHSVTETMTKYEGRPPAGWMSPGANPGRKTEDFLAEFGYHYTLDWPLDEQPVALSTEHGQIWAIPYPHEVNDVPMIAFHHGSSRAFADMVTDSFDELLEQSHSASLVYGIVVHSFIVGQPHRLRHFRRALQHIVANSSDVWFTTPNEIATYYESRVVDLSTGATGS